MATKQLICLLSNNVLQGIQYIELAKIYDQSIGTLLNITHSAQQQIFSSSLFKYYSKYQQFFRSELQIIAKDALKKQKVASKVKNINILEAAFLAINEGATVVQNKFQMNEARQLNMEMVYSEEQFDELVNNILNERVSHQLYHLSKIKQFDYYNLSLATEVIEKIQLEIQSPFADMEAFRTALDKRILSEMKPQISLIYKGYKEMRADNKFDYTMLLTCCFSAYVLHMCGYCFDEAEKGYKIIVSKNGAVVYELAE
ncbi:hypothetical protein SS50377_26462 [Spironucleus salmonicida]|uniref:Uncharacterized protein n=1 Tax=Spironucleus salmonicida TaxID=348837 RepID=V6LAA7_9EUKA|nr:hypothetical protein SS50377_26462 [Spironucleus salmonicida]|eukprot:EST41322.1 Hypothetical protein SS50377_ja003 [Spironucleus salmonicida]